ncbi:O-antigen ligase family protein [Salinimicrobium soli]|uniref:O-antigen ligase family protein n=1 Tax=Salinimicrobium soli TaxID=1254399 RepID=UPI003AAA7E18
MRAALQYRDDVFQKAISSEYVRILLLHLGIAFAVNTYEKLAFFHFLGAFGYFLFITIQNENRNNEALFGAAYLVGAEVFWRMTSATIFYETGKYGVILFLLIGMFFKGASSKTVPYWIYLLVLMPGIIIASMALDYDTVFRKAIAFNLAGPVCLGVSALYCYYKKITRYEMEKVIIMLLMPLITTMAYLHLYTPRLDQSLISMSGNYAATGGYGPNQISTVLGMGAFLLVTRLFVIRTRWINIVDLFLLGVMSYRAMVTFSRGGVITAFICVVSFIIIWYYKQGAAEKTRINFKVGVLLLAMFLSWIFTNFQTGGLIFNRYTNRNAAGQLKDDITTGRAELVETELEGFYHNPVLGLGVGKGYDFRKEELGIEIASHSEISRLLSEHGMLGVVAVLILIFVPLLFWLKFKNNYYFLAFVAFWFLTINHSAMRIAMPAFVYGLALLYIVDDKKQPVQKKKPMERLVV